MNRGAYMWTIIGIDFLSFRFIIFGIDILSCNCNQVSKAEQSMIFVSDNILCWSFMQPSHILEIKVLSMLLWTVVYENICNTKRNIIARSRILVRENWGMHYLKTAKYFSQYLLYKYFYCNRLRKRRVVEHLH